MLTVSARPEGAISGGETHGNQVEEISRVIVQAGENSTSNPDSASCVFRRKSLWELRRDRELLRITLSSRTSQLSSRNRHRTAQKAMGWQAGSEPITEAGAASGAGELGEGDLVDAGVDEGGLGTPDGLDTNGGTGFPVVLSGSQPLATDPPPPPAAAPPPHGREGGFGGQPSAADRGDGPASAGVDAHASPGGVEPWIAKKMSSGMKRRARKEQKLREARELDERNAVARDIMASMKGLYFSGPPLLTPQRTATAASLGGF